jgi:4-amino-4-deoxy-L-arabinose transferase-like glycosyltransferase
MGENRAGLARGAQARGWDELTGVLAAVIAAGALLRLATVGVQHFWLDEAVTAGLMRLDLDDMVGTMGTTESTPPLYYLIARGWAAVFGTGEVGLRMLSALLGTLTIAVAYGIGATLASRRAGLVAAALTAVSPALVWYSQEARAYSLAVLLAALSLLFAARAVTHGSARDVGWWALASALALLTHYFAGFLVAAEAVWLLVAHPNRRAAAIGTGAIAVCAAAVLPLALHQSGQGNLDFIGDVSLGSRLVDTAQLFLAGPTGERLDAAFAAIAAAAAFTLAVAVFALARAGAADRRAAVVLLALAAGGAVVPVLLAALGADYLLPRNLLVLWLPLTAAVAIGIAVSGNRRLGVAAVAVSAVGSLCVLVAVSLDPALQREAITAELTGSRLDAERERVDAQVGFALGSAGKTVTARADCDAGYTVATGNAAVRHGDTWTDVTARETAMSGGSAIGQQATERVDADGTVVQVVAVCTRPRE